MSNDFDDIVSQDTFYSGLYALFAQLAEYRNSTNNFALTLKDMKNLLESYIQSKPSRTDTIKSKLVNLKQRIDDDSQKRLLNEKILSNISICMSDIIILRHTVGKSQHRSVFDLFFHNNHLSPFSKGSDLEKNFIRIRERFHNKPIDLDLYKLLEYFRHNRENTKEVSWLTDWNKALSELNKYLDNTTPEVKNALDIITDTILKGQDGLNDARKYFHDAVDRNEPNLLSDEMLAYSKNVVAYSMLGRLDKLNANLINIFLNKLKEKVKWDIDLQKDYNVYNEFLNSYPEFFV